MRPPSRIDPKASAFACGQSTLDPILKFDPSGKLIKSFGAGLLLFPHGLHVDRAGNVWVTDALGRGGKGHQVFKFSPDGKVLLDARQAEPAGQRARRNSTRRRRSSTAPNGDIFVADGHGGQTNARIVKFDKDGKFIKTWGKKGSGPGELDIPHAIAMDSEGRLFVGDRQNNRIQIFDQDGKYIDQWNQFSRPSGIYHRQERQHLRGRFRVGVRFQEPRRLEARHPGRPRERRRGDGIHSRSEEKTTGTSAAEGVAADAQGNIYGAEVGPKRMMKYVKN